MPTWFQGTIKYQKEEIVTDRQGDQVRLKTITEAYLVDAVSYTDAEARLYGEIPANTPDFQIARISKMKLSDVFHIEDGGDTWYKAKVIFSTEDDKGREKKIVNSMLINANTVKQAYEQLEDSLKTILMPYEITDINRTPLLDIFPYNDENKIPANLKPLHEAVRTEEV
ncbi:DUF4494 domain-containing protein [Rudanella lutea]|uniref:DUF4494 domain-containing protein n=1 Tax=Rudanella lutea TaxID=451374 RepID=UPI00036BC091|nr:DUF4494 domain-containing protein [Rudanella lutea]